MSYPYQQNCLFHKFLNDPLYGDTLEKWSLTEMTNEIIKCQTNYNDKVKNNFNENCMGTLIGT